MNGRLFSQNRGLFNFKIVGDYETWLNEFLSVQSIDEDKIKTLTCETSFLDAKSSLKN